MKGDRLLEVGAGYEPRLAIAGSMVTENPVLATDFSTNIRHVENRHKSTIASSSSNAVAIIVPKSGHISSSSSSSSSKNNLSSNTVLGANGAVVLNDSLATSSNSSSHSSSSSSSSSKNNLSSNTVLGANGAVVVNASLATSSNSSSHSSSRSSNELPLGPWNNLTLDVDKFIADTRASVNADVPIAFASNVGLFTPQTFNLTALIDAFSSFSHFYSATADLMHKTIEFALTCDQYTIDYEIISLRQQLRHTMNDMYEIENKVPLFKNEHVKLFDYECKKFDEHERAIVNAVFDTEQVI